MKVITKLFRELFVRFPWHFLLLFGLVFSQALLNALSVVTIAPIIDFLMERTVEESSVFTHFFGSVINSVGLSFQLKHMVIIFCSITLASGLIGVAVQYSVLRIKYDILIYLLTSTLGQFFQASFLFFSQGDMGKLLNSFQQEVNKVGDTFGGITKLLANVLQVLIFLVLPLYLSPLMTLVFLVSVFIISGPLWLMNKFTYRLGQKNTETANRSAGVLHEILTSAKLILSFGKQKHSIDLYKQSIVRHATVSVKFQTMQNGFPLLMISLGMIAAIISVYVAFLYKTSFSEMSMVLFAFFRMIPIIGQILHGKTSIEGFVPAYEQLEKLRQEAKDLTENYGELPFKELKKSLIFNQVTFSYPGRKPTLVNINIKVQKGKMTALAGKSGTGKTTVVDLMLGLYQPSGGEILIDGKNFKEYDLNSYRQRVGYVPQDPQLFNASVRENLLWSAPKANEKIIWNACRMANAEQFVQELPEKLDTILGDRGVRLSGGQRQRLALARAIIRKPDLLILDEATSSLDTESEKLIKEAIDNLAGEMTIVIIAHRLSTIRNADYIYVLEAGRIVEEGSYSQLSKKSEGKLSRMIFEQAI